MGQTTTLVLVSVVVIAGYSAAVMFWPFAACLKCGGDGKRRSPSGRTWRTCPRCKGTGARLRWGRHVLNHIRSNTRNR